MDINCEKCGTIATGLTRLLAKHQQREHVLNHRRGRVGVIVTVVDGSAHLTSGNVTCAQPCVSSKGSMS